VAERLTAGEPVRFDFDNAARLASLLRGTADELYSQKQWRHSLAERALEEWRGVFSQRFTVRMNLCFQGADALALAMRTAAEQIDRMAEAAREEQRRQQQAQAWIDEQNSMNAGEQVVDWISDRIFGDDRPPDYVPGSPPRVTVPMTITIPGSRD
jgi:uncharacterized protein YukE